MARGVRVLLVDNGSSDGTPGFARERFPGVEVLENGGNLGFAAGNNTGIRHALARGAETVLLLNNDTVVDPDFLDPLLETAAAHPDAGFLCPKILFADRPEVIWFAGATFRSWNGHTRHIGIGERDLGQYDSVREIARPCGCAVLVTRALIDGAGLLEEAMFAYCEDVEWMLRARPLGFRALLVGASRVWHKVSAASGGPRAATGLYYGTRNTLYLLDRHFPLRHAPRRWLRVAAVVAVHLASIFTLRLDRRAALGAVRQGVADWSRGRMGARA
jgi:GT2 family glycosyltransferase